MSDHSHILVPFSLNWGESVEGAVRSTGGRVLRQPDVVATDVGRPAGLMNGVVLLEPLQDAAMASLMTSLDAFFAFGSVSQEGQPLYTRMGYRHVCDMPLWIRERP